jgi:hypothetical protein
VVLSHRVHQPEQKLIATVPVRRRLLLVPIGCKSINGNGTSSSRCSAARRRGRSRRLNFITSRGLRRYRELHRLH